MIVNPYRPLTSGPVTVPANFCGMCWYGYPNPPTGNTPVTASPSLNYKLTYSNDWGGLGSINLWTGPNNVTPIHWSQIEKTQGVYTWTFFDAWVLGNKARGIDLCYSPMFMPTFYSANPAVDSSNFFGLGSGGPLTSLGRTGYANFITAVLNRAISLGYRFKYYQAWEEPWWPVTNNAGKNNGYWWGTQGDLVDLAYIGYNAAKAVDPNIIVLSCSASPNASRPEEWINNAGTVNTGIKGYQTYDWIGVDIFGAVPTNWPQSNPNTTSPPWGNEILGGGDGSTYFCQMPLHQQTWTEAVYQCRHDTLLYDVTKPNAPIALTSFGFSDIGNGLMATWFRGLTATQRYQWMARSLLECAAVGVQFVIVYGGDAWTFTSNSYIFSGDFINDTNGVIKAFNEIAANVAGKTMTFCGVTGDGVMTAFFNDGSTYTV
jgi:hypothetical protein